jgi:hypothetical protein
LNQRLAAHYFDDFVEGQHCLMVSIALCQASRTCLSQLRIRSLRATEVPVRVTRHS